MRDIRAAACCGVYDCARERERRDAKMILIREQFIDALRAMRRVALWREMMLIYATRGYVCCRFHGFIYTPFAATFDAMHAAAAT